MTNIPAHEHWTDDPELVSGYVMGRLSAAARTPLSEHLKECAPCREAVGRENDVAASIKRAGRELLKERLSARLRTRDAVWYQRYEILSLAAAVFIILIGLGIFRYYVGSPDWPSKFSSNKYVVTHGAADSLRNKNVEGNSGLDEENANALSQSEEGAGKSGSFWLIGKVVVADAEIAVGSGGANYEDSAGGIVRVVEIGHDGAEQLISLRQVSLSLLPQRRADQIRALGWRGLETLVERSSQGLNLTLYRNTLVQPAEFSRAGVEVVGRDSLIVEIGKERIAYKIPGGWGNGSSNAPSPDRQ